MKDQSLQWIYQVSFPFFVNNKISLFFYQISLEMSDGFELHSHFRHDDFYFNIDKNFVRLKFHCLMY